MGRKVTACMDEIFNRLKESVTEDDQDRIIDIQRHIQASDDKEAEKKVMNFVKSAKLKKISIIDFSGCLFNYEDKIYILLPPRYDKAMAEMEIRQLCPTSNKEIIQGCEMLAIVEGILRVSDKVRSLEIIDKCLGISEEDGIVYKFDELRAFFEPSSVYEVSSGLFPIVYNEDIYRLCCYCICDQSTFINTNIKKDIKQLVLLRSAGSIALSIINGLKSPVEEYAYLQMYQCLEYLFRLNNSVKIHTSFDVDLDKAIDITTQYELKISELDNLISVIETYITEGQAESIISKMISETKGISNKKEKIAKEIYGLRCYVAHLRYGQTDILKKRDWNQLLEAITELANCVYQNCDETVISACCSKQMWQKIAYSIKGE